MQHIQLTKTINFICLTLIVLLALVVRVIQLGNVPFGITNDNASYIYSAYSVWKTGRGIDGSFLPLSFNTDSSNSPVPIYLDAPFVGLMGVSSLSGRLPYALSGVGSVIILYGIVLMLFKKKSIALLSSLVLAISPWAIFINRTSYEANIAFFFYLLSFYIFLKKIHKGSVLWSLPFFFLAFYSYHATKIFYIFLIPLLIGLYRFELLQRKKELVLFCLGSLAIVVSFFIVLKTQNVTRQDVLLTSSPDAAKQVDLERTKSIAPEKIKEIFNNKPLYFLRVIRENYLEVLSPQFLFLYGDTGSSGGLLGMYSRGEMYIIELPFLLLGLYFLARQQNKKPLLFLGLLVLLGPLGSTFTVDKTYPLRDVMLLLPLTIFVGLGLYQFISWVFTQNKISSTILILATIGLYIFLFGSFLNQYFYRYPIYGGENWLQSTHVVVSMAGQSNKKHIYLVSNNEMFPIQYAIFNKIDPQLVQQAWGKKDPQLGNVTILDECLGQGKGDPHKLVPKDSLYITPSDCYTGSSNNGTIRDIGEPIRNLWNIYEN